MTIGGLTFQVKKSSKISLGTNVLLHSLLGSNTRIISAWRTGSNPVEACTLLGAFAIIAKIACPPARIKSLVEFHPRVKWNLFVQRLWSDYRTFYTGHIQLPEGLGKHKGNTVLFYLFVFSSTTFSPSPPPLGNVIFSSFPISKEDQGRSNEMFSAQRIQHRLD